MEKDETDTVVSTTDKPTDVPIVLTNTAAKPIAPESTTNIHEKTLIATRIYTKWRNQFLGSMPQQAFLLVENSSTALIAAITSAL